MTKKLFTVVFAIVLCSTLFLGAQEFTKGGKYLTPQIGLNSYTVPIGANFEYGISDNVGIGGSLMLWLGSGWTVINPSGEVAYHFTKIEVDKLDVFAGGSIGFSIYSSDFGTGSSGIFLSPFGAARYYFSDKMAGMLKLYFSITGDWNGVGAIIGLTFRM
jgi:hypothetical protein